MLKLNKLGFTLIELIIVAGILGMIATASIAILNPFEQFKKGTDARIKSDLSQVQKALETYYGDKGRYPSNSVDYKVVDASLGTINWGSNWSSYMSSVPKDPNASNTYIYYSPNGQTYYLYANLNRGAKDLQVCNNGNACTNVPSGVSCGGICNFGVSSPNVSP